MIVPVLDAVTSLFAGCTIFVTLGYMAHKANLPIDKVVEQGIVFILVTHGNSITSHTNLFHEFAFYGIENIFDKLTCKVYSLSLFRDHKENEVCGVSHVFSV